MQMGLAFAGLLVVGAMAMAMYELFSARIEKHTTAWAHRQARSAGQKTIEVIGPVPEVEPEIAALHLDFWKS
jgi:hypothetical protein